MRKVFALFMIFAFVGITYADQSSVSPAGYTYPPAAYQGAVTLTGKPGTTKNITIADNTAGSLPVLFAAAGGTYFASSVTPVGAWISCVAKPTHWAFGGTTATASVGHVLDNGVLLHLANPSYVSTASAFGYDGGAVTCTVTLEY